MQGCNYRWVILAAAVILLISCLSAGAQDGGGRPPLQGTFIQLTNARGDWDTYDWEELFSSFQRLGLTTLVVQWSVYDGVGFFKSENFKNVLNPPLPIILNLADRAGMKVYVGLVHDSEYWNKIQGNVPMIRFYLERLGRESAELAAELVPLVAGHSSFTGWYIPQEIDDLSWQRPSAREVLAAFLGGIVTDLHRLTPGREITLSGFSNAAMDPRAFAEFWGVLLTASGVDGVMFQDGIGTGKFEPEELPLYLDALNQAVQDSGRRLFMVTEIFTQKGGPPLDSGMFRAEPAPLDRIERQLRIAAVYTDTLIAFSVPEYMSPQGGPLAGQLYDNYLKTLPGPSDP